jgi:hypothetical protein
MSEQKQKAEIMYCIINEVAYNYTFSGPNPQRLGNGSYLYNGIANVWQSINKTNFFQLPYFVDDLRNTCQAIEAEISKKVSQ